jgi:hypothetical protein
MSTSKAKSRDLDGVSGLTAPRPGQSDATFLCAALLCQKSTLLPSASASASVLPPPRRRARSLMRFGHSETFNRRVPISPAVVLRIACLQATAAAQHCARDRPRHP